MVVASRSRGNNGYGWSWLRRGGCGGGVLRKERECDGSGGGGGDGGEETEERNMEVIIMCSTTRLDHTKWMVWIQGVWYTLQNTKYQSLLQRK